MTFGRDYRPTVVRHHPGGGVSADNMQPWMRAALRSPPMIPTFAEILAAVDLPLDRFESSEPAPQNAKEVHRQLLRLQPGKFQPGGEWDETTPAGREALMLELGFVPEVP